MSSIYNNGYSFFLRIKAFNSENTFHIILYYTDDIAICLNRAAERHTTGLHLVSPDTIAEMYRNTISLLMANFKIADEITFIDVRTFDAPSACGRWKKPSETIKLSQVTPDWMKRLKVMLEPHSSKISIKKYKKENHAPPAYKDIVTLK